MDYNIGDKVRLIGYDCDDIGTIVYTQKVESYKIKEINTLCYVMFDDIENLECYNSSQLELLPRTNRQWFDSLSDKNKAKIITDLYIAYFKQLVTGKLSMEDYLLDWLKDEYKED